MDVDLFNAVAQKFGVKVEWQPAGFDTIITGVQSGKYDVGVSSFTINDERKQQVNMVSYFTAGTQWATAKGNPKGVDPDDACGKTIAVQKGTDADSRTTCRKRQASCKTAGKPAIKLVVRREPGPGHRGRWSRARPTRCWPTPPSCSYAIKQTNGQLELLGEIYDAAPYGYVIPKAETEFAQAIVDALKAMNADGTYKQHAAEVGRRARARSPTSPSTREL